MALLERLTGIFKKDRPPDPEAEKARLAAEEEIRARLLLRCNLFRRLLSANKTALEIMSEVEEKLASGQPFGMGYARGAGARCGAAVFSMVRALNELSDNAWPGLGGRLSAILAQIERDLDHREKREPGPYVIPLNEAGMNFVHETGGKMASLGEAHQSIGMPIPDGFVVTASAYYHFMAKNGLQDEIDRLIQASSSDGLDSIFNLSTTIRKLIQQAPMPEDLEQAITSALCGMQERGGASLRLALRSSAMGEDAKGSSFAGQYHSELNVHPDETLEVWRDIVASKYDVTAMNYRFERGIADDAVPMCVGVLAMIEARAGGVVYSRDPLSAHGGDIIINSVPGLPKAVVDGSFNPDMFTCSRSRPVQLKSSIIAQKPFRFDCDPQKGIVRSILSSEEGGKPSISADEAVTLAGLGLMLEEFYAEPQDVEWALDKRGNIIILQSRSITGSLEEDEEGASAGAGTLAEGAVDSSAKDNTAALNAPHGVGTAEGGEFPDLPVLMSGGVCVSPGVGFGKVFFARKDADILAFPAGSVLVVERALPRWAVLLSRAAAVISESGGMAGHLAGVAREYSVPAIFGLQGALASLAESGEITVDAVRGRVYPDAHPEVGSAPQRKNMMRGSMIYEALSSAAKFMVPLSLLDPSSPNFSPENCKSLHDITRFCHEKSVELMFGGEEDLQAGYGKQLKDRVKLQYWVIDLGGGFKKPVSGPIVELSNINSGPMLELWHGMIAVPWAGPPDAGAAGFMSVVFESAMRQDLEASVATKMDNRNFMMISESFMLLQARFGYHFCTVEAQAGESAHENYLSFQFKGGAANNERRVLRAAMVGDLLEEYGFKVDVKEDALFAVAEGYEQKDTLMRARLLGYLLIHTRQVDMIMKDAGRAAELAKKLAADMGMLASDYIA